VASAHWDGTTYKAVVHGTDRYTVELSLDGQRLTADCTCPYFDGSLDPCKHIWATILKADEAGVFSVPAGVWLNTDDGPTDEELADLDLDEAGTYDPLEGDGGDDGWSPLRDRYEQSDRMRRAWAGGLRPGRAPEPPPAWQMLLARVAELPDAGPPRGLLTGEVIYVVDASRSSVTAGLHLDVQARERKRSGDWAKPKALSMTRGDIRQLPDERDRILLESLCGASQAYAYAGFGGSEYGSSLPVPPAFALGPTLQRELVPRISQTGRFLLRPVATAGASDPALVPIEWDATPTAFHVRIVGDAGSGYTISGLLRHGDRDRDPADALVLTRALVLWRPDVAGGTVRMGPFAAGGTERWLAGIRELGAVTVPATETAALVERIAMSGVQSIDCPDDLRVEIGSEAPHPVVRVTRPAHSRYGSYGRLDVALAFAYGEREVDAMSPQPVCFDPDRRRAWRRDTDAERTALARLLGLGVRRLADWQSGGSRLDCAETLLPTLVRVLLSEGWRVEAEGKLYRRAGAPSLAVRSGIDWFELHGGIDFEGVSATLPALLAAAKRGDTFVPLGDGTFGLLPESWLARAGRIAALGTPEADHVRFGTTQAALLDAWLAAEPAVSCDETFARARGELSRFQGVKPADPPHTFRGVLRDYQRDALGWFEFLRRFGFGGCLADEMGLGKTVMVLAALDARRLEREREGRPPQPSLVVVPRSLVFNWRQEAARFAPDLRVLDLTRADRREVLGRVGESDVVLATYGTLRKDIGHLKGVVFDYAVLDEAQAIKNAGTSAAKAARLVKATHRLALSGTPVENHLGELWSLFDFLNPGVLGASSVFTSAGARGRPADEELLKILARGLRPFILRRTKEQVARELPPRTEQTLYCDLEAPQRALYDELRDHYRASLLGTVARVGLGRAKLQVLEALLRLRQAACHPGLLDPARAGDTAAKLDVLMPRLQELVEEGRKVLVFSQFTSLLALVRARLDTEGLAYEYLDGKTRDREARVRRFQEDGCPLFLVSLKAGGLGLNLTAAEYVFLLDPWWNPAVEAQAIDRAHRIGQTRPVFAFRLIARDTVEEKVLELQATKRRLADAIVRADESLIRDLKREDLELLLS
jgi:superfamily II DNA or RNA helicase